VDIIQYNAMHKFVGVLDNPPRQKTMIMITVQEALISFCKNLLTAKMSTLLKVFHHLLAKTGHSSSRYAYYLFGHSP